MNKACVLDPDFQALFESAPACYLVLLTDFTIVAVSDSYLKATMTKRSEILGRQLFDVFPDNPEDPAATGVSNLNASLQRVLKSKMPDTMAVQKYDIRRPEAEGGGFEERYWSPVNSPVFGDKHEVVYIIHRVEDVTEFVRLKQSGAQERKATEELKMRAEQMETELFLRVQELQSTNKRLLDNEIFLDSIIENLPNMIFVKEAKELRFVLFNRAGEKLLGYARSDLIGKNDYDFFPKDQADFFVNNDRQVLDQGALRDIPEEPIQTRHQGTRFLHTKKIPILDSEGHARYLLGISEDITERKAAEERFHAVAETANDALIIGDHQGNILYFNKAAENCFGYGRDELIGKPLTLLMPARFHADHLAGFKRFVATGEKRVVGKTVELIGRKKNGQEFFLDLSLASWKEAENLYFTGIVRDITEQRAGIDALRASEQRVQYLNQHLQYRNAELEAVNRELEAFSYSVSHDLRAPLRAIDGFSQEILNSYADRLDAQGQDYLQRVRAASQRMGELIDDMLKLARITRAELLRSEVDLSALAHKIFSEQRLRAPARRIEISITPHLSVSADPGLMRAALENLLNNASKFSRHCPHARIEFGSLQQDNEKVFFVRDNGAGFDMAYAGKLFGAFQRLHAANEFEGTGIGLATVQRIIRRHGGRIWAEAQVDCGATFFFTLPP